MMNTVLDSILDNPVEYQVLALGVVFGALLIFLWDPYREAAMFLLGFAVAMVLAQPITPWAPGYEAVVTHRPLAAKPWYFLVPLVVVLHAGLPMYRLVKPRISTVSRDD